MEQKVRQKNQKEKIPETKRKRKETFGVFPEFRWRRQSKYYFLYGTACDAKDSLAAKWNEAASAAEMITDDCYKAQEAPIARRLTAILLYDSVIQKGYQIQQSIKSKN